MAPAVNGFFEEKKQKNKTKQNFKKTKCNGRETGEIIIRRNANAFIHQRFVKIMLNVYTREVILFDSLVLYTIDAANILV